MRLDCWRGKKVSNVSARGMRCATGCLRRGSQPRAVGSQWPRGGSLGSARANGVESKVWFLGIVGYAWARTAAPDCVANPDTTGVDSWIIDQFRQREGVACVAAPRETAGLKGKVAKSGTVWRGLVPSRHQPSIDKLDTIPTKSLKVWPFPRKEGGWCGGGMGGGMSIWTILCLLCMSLMASSASAQKSSKTPSDDKSEKIEMAIKQFSTNRSPEAVERLEKFGPPVRHHLRKRIRARDRRVFEREVAMVLLERLDDGEATEDLLFILQDDSETAYFRAKAAACLHKIGRTSDKRTFRALKNQFHAEKNETVRRNILMALGRVGQIDSLSELKSILAGNEPDRVKTGAIYGISAIDDPTVIDILIAGLKRDDSTLTMEYVRVLSRSKRSKKVVPELLEKLDSLNASVKSKDRFWGAKRMVIFQSLGQLDARSARGVLRAYLDSERILDVLDAGLVLCKLGDRVGVAKAIKRADDAGELWIGKKLKTAWKTAHGKNFSR